ncbi:MAG: apolipoprotein N-acyltransferase [Lentisphaeria bacterium]|nr:apolipoprotein N-acyltransferase [Lentisphaeria bacterium]
MKESHFSIFFRPFRADKATPEELAFRVSWKRTVRDLLAAALSGAALTLAFPGVNFQPAAWVCIVPLLWLCSDVSKRRAFGYGMTWGYFWSLTSTFFLREINIAIPFVFGAVLGVFCAFWAMLIPVVCRDLLIPPEVRVRGAEAVAAYPRFQTRDEILAMFTLAAWWVILEWIRSWIFTGFPWNLLAATQWQNLNLIQICEYTGIYGLSFLVILVNIALFFTAKDLLAVFRGAKYRRPLTLYAALFLVAAAAFSGMGVWKKYNRLYAPENVTEYPVGVVQPDLSQRRAGGEASTREALDACSRLSEDLIADKKAAEGLPADFDSIPVNLPPTLRLIVWPETAVPTAYYSPDMVWADEESQRTGKQLRPVASRDVIGEEYRKRVRRMIRESGTPFLIGTITYDNIRSGTEFDMYNSALLLKEFPLNGGNVRYNADAAGRYDKVHIVPFGEFIPLNDKFPAIGRLVGMGRNLTPGKAFRPLDLAKDVRAGVMICYEDVFAYAARELVRNGANFLLVITNDAWYPTSTEPEQHYANSVLRTVETRLPMLRCGNSNYSVLIDQFGRTVDSVTKRIDPETGMFELTPWEQKAASGVLTVKVPKHYTPTFYVKYGNVFVLVLWVIFAGGMAMALRNDWIFRKNANKPEEAKPPLK